jgi:hypothetical protein
MSKQWMSLIALGMIALYPATGSAQFQCPPVVQQALDMLNAKTQSAAAIPRQLAGARSQDVQVPRGQDVQAPRGQDVQAPRGQDVQAPRGQDVQAPRVPSAQVQSSTLANARRLVNEAEAACKASDAPRATANARAAIELLNYLP